MSPAADPSSPGTRGSSWPWRRWADAVSCGPWQRPRAQKEQNRAPHLDPLLPPLPEAVPVPAEVSPPVARVNRGVPRGPAACGGCCQAAARRVRGVPRPLAVVQTRRCQQARRGLTVRCARRLSGEPVLVVEKHLNSVWFRKIGADSAVRERSKPE